MSQGHDNEIAVHVEGLRKAFGSVRAVDGLELAIGRGEIFGLVGPDGAGKTTTMRILVGLIPADSGQAEICSVDVLSDPEAVKSRIGYLSQAFSMYGDLTVAENVAFFGDVYQVPRQQLRQRADELLAMTGLAPFRRRLADALSGGMKQKLALCCTLIHRPEVLLLDEPTTGVDPVSRRDFWRLLYGLPSEGVTVVVSTPYMDEAARCGRVGFMREGRLLACGTPESLVDEVGAVWSIACDAQARAAALRALRAQPDVVAAEVFGDDIHVYSHDDALGAEALRTVLAEAGIPASSVEQVRAGLEDAFIWLLLRGEDGPAGDGGL